MPAKSGSRRKSGTKAKSMRQEAKIGLVFPVGRLNRMIKHGRFSERVSISAGCFLAGVLEWMCAEILEPAANICVEKKKKLIAPNHINLAIRSDEEFNMLMCETVIASGGKVPYINEFFAQKKGGKSAAVMGSQPV